MAPALWESRGDRGRALKLARKASETLSKYDDKGGATGRAIRQWLQEHDSRRKR